jgi:hypothetical protein
LEVKIDHTAKITFILHSNIQNMDEKTNSINFEIRKIIFLIQKVNKRLISFGEKSLSTKMTPEIAIYFKIEVIINHLAKIDQIFPKINIKKWLKGFRTCSRDTSRYRVPPFVVNLAFCCSKLWLKIDKNQFKKRNYNFRT